MSITKVRAHAVIRLHPNDDVVIATRQLVSGTRIEAEDLVVSGLVPPGHKIATRAIVSGEPVKRYNQIIGVAREPIARGQHVHVHNLAMTEFEREHAFGADAHSTGHVAEPAQFLGIRRDDGRVATRNYIGVLTSVNCSATDKTNSYLGRSVSSPERGPAGEVHTGPRLASIARTITGNEPS